MVERQRVEGAQRAASPDRTDASVRLLASYAAAQKGYPPLAELNDRVQLATELARAERWLLDEVADVSASDDLAEQWPLAARELTLVLPPTIAAVRAALHPGTPQEKSP